MKFDELYESTRLLKHFMNDISAFCRNDYSKVDYNYYKRNSDQLKFYITKSFLNDNFDGLFEKSNMLLAEYVFKNKLNEARTIDAREEHEISSINKKDPIQGNSFLKEKNPKDFCAMDERFSADPKLAYKLIRNSLSHFEYTIKKDHIIIKKEYYKENITFECEISISSLSTLVASTIGFPGFSCEEGAYDYAPFTNASNPEKSVFIKIQNLGHNSLSPSHFIRIYKSVHRGADSSSAIIKDIKNTISHFPSKLTCNFYVRAIHPDDNIMRKAGISKVSNDTEVTLYLLALDEKIRYGGVYLMINNLINELTSEKNKRKISSYEPYFSIIANTVFISFMTIVFDDYFIHNFNGKLDPNLFTEMTGIDINDIPRRLRNSLAHSRYRFENIFDASKGIIIEFWDEKNGKKTFECKISKENAEKLTKEYLDSILSYRQ